MHLAKAGNHQQVCFDQDFQNQLLTGDVYLYLFEQKFKANHTKIFGFHNLNSNFFFLNQHLQ